MSEKAKSLIKKEGTIEFIEAVRMYQGLYDKLHIDYKNVFKKKEIWKNIAEECGIKGFNNF